MKVQLVPPALRALLGSEVQQDLGDPLAPQGARDHRALLEQQERKASRGRKAPSVLLAAMGCRVQWGFLVLLDPQAWQERMETRVRWATLDRRALKGTRASMALLDPLGPLVLWGSLEQRGQMGSPVLGVPRGTLVPKVTKEQEDSMGLQDPLVCRVCQAPQGRRERQETWALWDHRAPQDLEAQLDPTELMVRKAPQEVLGTWVPLEKRGSQESRDLRESRASLVSRVHAASVGRKESRGSLERRDHQGLKAPRETMAPKGIPVLLVFLVTLGLLEKLAPGARMALRGTAERTESQDSLDPLVPLGRTDLLDHLESGVLPVPLALRGDRERKAPRGIPVLWAPRERQAPWVLQARQENLVLMVCGGSRAQWVSKAVLGPRARPGLQVLWDPQGFLVSGAILGPRERRVTQVSSG